MGPVRLCLFVSSLSLLRAGYTRPRRARVLRVARCACGWREFGSSRQWFESAVVRPRRLVSDLVEIAVV